MRERQYWRKRGLRSNGTKTYANSTKGEKEMISFFGKSYRELRNHKIKHYERFYLYKSISQETFLSSWPISNYPSFHSLSEFGLQLTGIILKPILCMGEIIVNLLDAFFSLITSPISLLWLDYKETTTSFFHSLYCFSYVLYMIVSMIFDPILAFVSVALRSIATLTCGLSVLFELTVIIDPKTPTVEILSPTSTEIFSPMTGSSGNFSSDRISRTSSSLETIPLYDSVIKEGELMEWNNAPIF